MTDNTAPLPDTRIPYAAVIDRPIPAPACEHEHATIIVGTISDVAVVRCEDCPAHWVTRVWEVA